jgi:hypothetical protein
MPHHSRPEAIVKRVQRIPDCEREWVRPTSESGRFGRDDGADGAGVKEGTERPTDDESWPFAGRPPLKRRTQHNPMRQTLTETGSDVPAPRRGDILGENVGSERAEETEREEGKVNLLTLVCSCKGKSSRPERKNANKTRSDPPIGYDKNKLGGLKIRKEEDFGFCLE